MLSMFSAWGRSRSHRLRGNSLSAPQRIATKLILEGLDGLLGAVMAVVVGWAMLICHLVALYCFLELVRAFVVKDVVLGHNSSGM
jgi:hypothetical protein